LFFGFGNVYFAYMNKLYEPEIIRSVNGIGWTVVRYGRDEVSSFQNWIGENFDDFENAEKASVTWEQMEPSFGIDCFVSKILL
jgi:hypothetical protein